MLYRLYGGDKAEEVGHYWTVEPHQGNTGFQLDYAMSPRWGSTLSESAELYVPPGIFLYEGYAAGQKIATGYQDFGGGGWQVLIPIPVLQPLLKAQQAMREGKGRSEVEAHIKEATSAQSSLIERYERETRRRDEETLKEFCSMENAQRLLKTGNALQKVPESTRSLLQSESCSTSDSKGGSTTSDVPTGSYLVHRQEIRLPSGGTASLSLNVRLELSHETRTTSQSGRTRVTTITRHYKQIFEWV